MCDVTFDLGEQVVAEELVRRDTDQDEEHTNQEGKRQRQSGAQ
jgi:hypothetical protein